MKLLVSISFIFFIFIKSLIGQVKVGDNPTTINPNAILELESLNQGLLMPRVALRAISNPAPLTAHIQGMTIYNTTSSSELIPGFYFNDGSKWVRLANNFTTVNGLHVNQNNELMLGGQLSQPTVIGTSGANTLAFTGLGQGNVGVDDILTIDPVTGVISRLPLQQALNREMESIMMTSEGQTQFQTPLPITPYSRINVYRNGVRIGLTIINSNTIALESGVVCSGGDEIRIVQFY